MCRTRWTLSVHWKSACTRKWLNELPKELKPVPMQAAHQAPVQFDSGSQNSGTVPTAAPRVRGVSTRWYPGSENRTGSVSRRPTNSQARIRIPALFLFWRPVSPVFVWEEIATPGPRYQTPEPEAPQLRKETSSPTPRYTI